MSCVAINAPLRSFKLIEISINRQPACNAQPACKCNASDFLLVIRCNCVPVFYHVRDITVYWTKICFYAVFTLPGLVEGLFPWDIHRLYSLVSRVSPVSLKGSSPGTYIGYTIWYQEFLRSRRRKLRERVRQLSFLLRLTVEYGKYTPCPEKGTDSTLDIGYTISNCNTNELYNTNSNIQL